MKIRINQRYFWGLVVFFFANITIKLFVLDVVKVLGNSMEPTLVNGSYLLVSKYHGGMRLPQSIFEVPWINNICYFLFSDKYIDSILQKIPREYKYLKKIEIRRNDIVVFNIPYYMSSFAIKRCIGMPGDSIHWYTQKDSLLSVIPYKGMRINNKKFSLEQQHKLKESYYFSYESSTNEWVSTTNFYFMQGDNKEFSIDSRLWGVVPEDHVFAKIIYNFR